MIAAVAGAIAIAAYLCGVRAYGRRFPQHPFGFWRIAAFVCGVVVIAGALLPPVDAIADGSFGAHMAQHVVLMLIGPPLLLLGAPLLLLVAATPPAVAKRVTAIAKHPVAHALFSPVTAWLLFVFTIWGVHFSPLYEAALQSEAVHVLEHVLFVTVALLFWIPVVQVGYAPRPVAFPARMLYLFLALPQGAFLGLALYASHRVLYPHYADVLGPAGALSDQHDGGAVMWIAGGFLLFVAFMLTAGAWAADERREAVAQ